jgi:hypothetical protein
VILNREAGAAAARGLGLRVDHPKSGPDQIVDEVDLRSLEISDGHLIYQYGRSVAHDSDVVVVPPAIDLEPVLKTRAAAAFHADPQYRPRRLIAQYLADPARRAFGDSDVLHRESVIARGPDH